MGRTSLLAKTYQVLLGVGLYMSLSPLTILNLQTRVSSTLSRTVAWTDMLSQGALKNCNLETAPGVQRRCYWLLENDEGIVLVHYLNAGQTRNRNGVAPVTKSGLANSGSKSSQATKADMTNLLQVICMNSTHDPQV